jgi:hypothetical protein
LISDGRVTTATAAGTAAVAANAAPNDTPFSDLESDALTRYGVVA